MQKLFGTLELASISWLLKSETCVRRRYEQGLESYDSTVLGVHAHFFLNTFFGLSLLDSFSDSLLNYIVKHVRSVQANTVFFGQILQIDVNEFIELNFCISYLLFIHIVSNYEMNELLIILLIWVYFSHALLGSLPDHRRPLCFYNFNFIIVKYSRVIYSAEVYYEFSDATILWISLPSPYNFSSRHPHRL